MYTKDADHRVTPLPCGGRAGKTKDASGPAMRTRVANFNGSGFVAEREGDDLVIYLVTNDPVPTMTVGDARSAFDKVTAQKIADLQDRYRTFHRESEVR